MTVQEYVDYKKKIINNMNFKIKKLLDRYALNKELINSRKSILRKYECTGNYDTDIIPLLENRISFYEKK